MTDERLETYREEDIDDECTADDEFINELDGCGCADSVTPNIDLDDSEHGALFSVIVAVIGVMTLCVYAYAAIRIVKWFIAKAT